MDLLHYVVIAVAGCVAGFMNVTAGGGSLLILPLLVFAGMDISVANGTNRIAILCQNIVAMGKFKKEGILSVKKVVPLAVPAAIGSIAGSFLAVSLDEKVLRAVIAVLILIMAFLLVVKPKMWERQQDKKVSGIVLSAVFFFLGAYGGFIQAGVGFFMLWGLVGLVGMDLLHANAVKVSIIAFYTVLSLCIFIFQGIVDFRIGTVLALGNMAGGYLGAKFSIAKGNSWLRWILAVIVIASALKMLLSAFL
jgi:uncharacterized membrane protein YfcA